MTLKSHLPLFAEGDNLMSVNFRQVVVGPLLVLGMASYCLIVASEPAQAATSATVRVASGRLTERSGPATSYTAVGHLKNRSSFGISCKATGQRIAGLVRTTDQWDRLGSGAYVSHAYVQIGSGANKRLPDCGPVAQPSAPDRPQPHSAMGKDDFIAASAVIAQANQREYRIPASVTIAQAILESGWGRSELANAGNNFFGIKCYGLGPFATGCLSYTTDECDSRGRCGQTVARFRAYSSALDSFRDHARLLATRSRYAQAFRHTNNANEFIRAVHQAGYATSPSYTETVQRIMKKYDLYRYDS